MNTEFFNMPKHYGKDVYIDVLRKIEKRYSSEDLIAIYDWGTPKHPGISDSDVLMVWKNHPKPLPLAKRSFAFLDNRSRYVLRHPFMHISEEDFSFIKYVYPNVQLRKVAGKTLKIQNLRRNEEETIKKAVLNDIVIRHYPRDFLQQMVEKKINVRDSLLRLNSLKYTFSALNDLGIKKKKEWIGIEKRVELLRENWFEKPNKQEVAELMNEAVEIIMDIISCGKSLVPLPKIANKELVYAGIKNLTVFTKDWSAKTSKQVMVDKAQKTGKWWSVLPIEYASLLAYYGEHKGPLSEYIHGNLGQHGATSAVNKNLVLGKRITVLNNQAKLAALLKHSDFPAFFDFGYRNTKGINNALLRISDRLRF